MRYLYDSFDNDGLGGNDLAEPIIPPMRMRRNALISEQFYRNQGRFAGPFIDYTDLQKGMQSFTYDSYSNYYNRMSIDIIYDVAYDNKVTFTFNVTRFDFNQNYKMVSDIPADLFTNAYMFKMYLYSIQQVRENRWAGDNRMFHFEMPTPINIKYAPQTYFHTHHEIKDIVFMTDLMMDVFYGDNKYKLDRNKINDEEYIRKLKTIQDKLISIEEDFK